MATKKSLIAAILAAGLAGVTEADLNKKTEVELEALAKENDITVADDKPKAKTEVKRSEDDPRTGKLVKCRIEPGHGPDGKYPVFASVNGYNFQAKRGEEIELDSGFVKHLKSITYTDVEAVVDEKTGKPTGEIKMIDRARFQITEL